MSIEPVLYSYTGKAADAEMYGEVTGTPAEIREVAVSLWCDLRQRQLDEGQKAKAAVWISQKRCQPSDKEIEAYEEKVRQIRENEAKHKESGEVEDESPDVVVEDDPDTMPVSELLVPPVGEPLAPPVEPTTPPIVLDDEDDLDF